MLFKPTIMKGAISGAGGVAKIVSAPSLAACLLRFLLRFPLDAVI